MSDIVRGNIVCLREGFEDPDEEGTVLRVSGTRAFVSFEDNTAWYDLTNLVLVESVFRPASAAELLKEMQHAIRATEEARTIYESALRYETRTGIALELAEKREGV